jgi:cellobiose phosphorylase
LIDPCIPSGWTGFEITRKFRGATYRVRVSNPSGVQKGVREITMNGKPMVGNILPILPGEHTVDVVMG